MIYLYKCPHCDNTIEIDKPMSENSRIEHCEICENILERKYEIGMIKTNDGIKSQDG